jgi:hypothetical protein
MQNILKVVLILFLTAYSYAQEIPAELVMRSFSHCFPGKTGEVVYQDNDWTIKAGGETFYWTEGRLLPRSLKDKASIYSPHAFYIYPDSIPLPSSFSLQYIAELRNYEKSELHQTDKNQNHSFHGIIYGGIKRSEIESNLQKIQFLGKTISVNREIAAALKRIDARIRETAKEDTAEKKQIPEFLDSIGQIGAYNWREIRGSNRMSYHSWGLAVDIQPKKPGYAAIYWRWEKSRNENWMLIPINRRWKPPDRLIELFEQEGFIWGGKWVFYDNMHFEYRPELHELNRLLASMGESYSINEHSDWRSLRDLHHLFPDGLK